MAGSEEIRDVVMRIRTDASGARTGNADAQRSFTELNQAVELGAKAADVVAGAFQLLYQTIQRGQAVSELSNSFKNLEAQFGGSETAISDLRDATQGLISDTDLMRASNQALLAGLSPDQFKQVAAAADTLGDAVGVDTKQAMDLLSTAVLTGNDRLLKQFGILVDNKKAEEDFARSIGTTADKLSETGKREAQRIAILAAMDTKVAELGDSSETAGDLIQKMSVQFNNAIDAAAQFVNENPRVISALKDIQEFAEKAGHQLKLLFSDSLEAQLEVARNNLKHAEEDATSFWSTLLGHAFSGELPEDRIKFHTEEIRVLTEAIRLAKKETEEKSRGGFFADISGLTPDLLSANAQMEKTLSFLKDTSKETAEAAKKTQELRNEYAKFVSDNAADSLKANFEKSLEAGNLNAARDFLEKYRGSVDQMADAYFKKFTDAGIKVTDVQRQEYIDKFIVPMSEKLEKSGEEAAKKLAENQKKAFQSSVDFFQDIFTSAIDGSAQDLEDTISDALKRVAVGFASQLAASVATSLGFGGVGGLGGASGLGQALATSLGFGGPGSVGLGSIVGGMGIPGIWSHTSFESEGLFGNIGELGTQFETIDSSLAGSSSSLMTIAASMAPIVAGAAGIFGIYQGIQTGNKPLANVSGAATFGLVTGGLSAILPGIASDFLGGGHSQNFYDAQHREDFINQLSQNGGPQLNPNNFNINAPQGSVAEGAVGFGNALSHALTGDGGKFGSDIAAIFAHSADDAHSLNEALVDMQSLMDSLGVTAEDVKKGLTDAFLDGKITLEEFGADIANTNLLAQQDLVGPNSLSDAFEIFGANIDKNPRKAIHGLALVFKELADAGITSTQQIHDYVAQTYPELVPIFDQFAAEGINSFDDIENASADTIYQIFSNIEPLKDEFERIFGGAGEGIDNGIGDGVERAKHHIDDLVEYSKRKGREIQDNLTPTISTGKIRVLKSNQQPLSQYR